METQLALYSEGGVLFIAFSPADAGWFRSAGLAATFCPDAAALTLPLLWHVNRKVRRTLVELRPRQRSSQQKEGTGAENVRPAPVLVLVNFSPALASLDAPAGLSVEVSKLAQADLLLEIDFPETCLWSPGAAGLEAFTLLQDCGANDQLHRAVLASVAHAARALNSLLPAEPPPPYPEARARYRTALTETVRNHLAGDDDVETTRRDFEGAVERELVGPLIECANACHNPVHRLGYAMLAEQCQHLFGLVPSIWREHAAENAPHDGDAARRFLGKIKGIAAIAKLLD